MVFKDAPAAFDRIVFAMVGRIISQTDRQLTAVRERYHPVHKPGAAAVMFRAIVQVDDQCPDPDKPRLDRLPPAFQNIHDKITRSRRGREIQEDVVIPGKQNTKGRQFGIGLEVMIAACRGDTAFSATRKRTDFHGSFGINGNAKHFIRCIGVLVYLVYLVEDRVGFRDLFLGLLFATVRGRYPKPFSFVRMVRTVGNASSAYPFRVMSWRRTSAALNRV